jgi:rhamnulokinase
MLKSLAFDFGASSGKAILSEFDGEKISLREIHRFSNDPVMFNGTLYWDILRLMNEMKHTLIRCYQEGHQDLASASSDTWGVDFGLLDKNGQLIANPVHYRDKRTDGMQEEAAKYVSDEEFYNSTGIQFMKLNTVYQLLALSKIQKELLDLADTLLFMPDLFNYYLSGEMLCEYSIASTSQLLNARTKEWDKAILKKLNIRDDLLKDPVPSGTPAGKLTKDMCQATGLRDVKIIATAGHDTASAVLAVPSSKKDFAYISSGTWSLLGTGLAMSWPFLSKSPKSTPQVSEEAEARS